MIADRNLLFGILALQMDFIRRDQLVAAMHEWVLAKTKPLGQILLEQGALARDPHALLEALVHEHVKQHGNDPEKSLAAVGAASSVKDALQNIADGDLHNSLGRVPGTVVEKRDPYATSAPPAVGTPSSSGLRFRILRPHARGGLGEVLVAQDEELHREVALKQIQDRHADNQESRTRFVVEAEITGGLEHPGIVPVYGLGKYADGRPFYAMRFIRGDSLKEAIEHFHQSDTSGRDPGQRNLELRQLLGRFVDVCQAIAYAHSRGVLHRDLKPGNIMLGKYGETLVVDWGLAKPQGGPASAGEPGEGALSLSLSSAGASTPTVMGTAVGTPQFMSPEQAAGQLDLLGPASDTYSLGATLYCLLTGQPPVNEGDVGAVLRKVQRGDFPKPRQVKPSIPPALEAICLQAMALKPQERYASPRLLAEDIEHWLADEPVSAWQEPWMVKAGRWLRRHRLLATGVATAVVVAAVGLAIATVLLTAANERERLAKEEALRQKTKAEENFRLARQAVDRYHTEVSESIPLRQAGFEPLRKKLLEAAREFYDRFVQERGNDPNVKGDFGKALYRLGLITADITSESKAIELLQQAEQVFEALGSEYRADLARCYHHLGRLHRAIMQYDKSEEAYRKALVLWKEIPNQPSELARSHLGLGNVLQVKRKYTLAREEYRHALNLWSQLAQADSKTPDLQRDLAVTHSNLAMVHSQLGERQPAQIAFGEAVKIQKQLVQAHANISQYQNDLARSNFLLGELYLQEEQNTQAGNAYQAAADLWDKLTKTQPAVLIYQTLLADAYGKLAKVYSTEKQTAKAVETCKLALDLRKKLDSDSQPNLRGDLAKGYFELGDVYRAAGQGGDAEAAYKAAGRLQEKLAQELTKDLGIQADRARTWQGLGLLRLDQKKWPEAEQAFSQSLAIWEKLHSEKPETPEFALGLSSAFTNLRALHRSGGTVLAALDSFTRILGTLQGNSPEHQPAVRQALVEAYWTRAEVRASQKDYREALQDWDRALKLTTDRERTWLRLYRGVTLARYGDHDQAIAEAKVLAPKAAGFGEALFELARVYALVAAALKNTGKKEAEQYVDRALDLLHKARATGFFQNPVPRKNLTDGPDWHILRPRENFQKLLREE